MELRSLLVFFGVHSLVVQNKLPTGPFGSKRKSLAELRERCYSYRHCQLNRLLFVVRNVQDTQDSMRAAHRGDNLDTGWTKKNNVAWLRASDCDSLTTRRPAASQSSTTNVKKMEFELFYSMFRDLQ